MDEKLSFGSFFQELPVPTIVLEGIAPDFIGIEVNESFLDFSQRSRKNCVGKTLPEYFREVYKETFDSFRSVLDQVLSKKKLVKSKIQQ